MKGDLRRAWAWVEINEAGCWVWTGAHDRKGYGRITVRGAEGWCSRGTHAVFYEWFVGPIPPDMTVDHLCRERACCCPNHLELVTLKENVLRGDSAPAINARKTHCKWGHPFTTENTIVLGRSRQCRTCRRERTQRWRQAQKAGS